MLAAPLDFLVQGIVDAYPSLQACFEHLDAGSRQELFSDLPFLFFLDSVDELSDATPLPSMQLTNCIIRCSGVTHSVFVITCRSEVLDSAVISSALPPRRQFLPHGTVQPALMTSLYLMPFSAAQRDAYVSVFAEKYEDINQRWTAVQYTHALKQFPELNTFLQEPLQLFLVLSVLPILVAGKEVVSPVDFCAMHQ